MCQGLRKGSEQHRWVWGALESRPGVDVAATSSSLLNRTWRPLGQLASWRRDGSEEFIETLVAVGRKVTEDEAAAAVNLALLAASQEPGAQRSAPEASVHCHRSWIRRHGHQGQSRGHLGASLLDITKIFSCPTRTRCSPHWSVSL